MESQFTENEIIQKDLCSSFQKSGKYSETDSQKNTNEFPIKQHYLVGQAWGNIERIHDANLSYDFFF